MAETRVESHSGLVGSAAKFQDSIVIGEEFETRFITAVEQAFGHKYEWVKHNSCSGTKYHCKCFDWEDIATQKRPTIECKKDWKSKYTGNLAFEAYCMTDKLKADYWVHEYEQDKALWFRVHELRAGIRALGSKTVWGGDDNRTEMYIVPMSYALKLRHLKLDLTKPLPPNMFT